MNQKVVLITGASNGIGKATAEKLVVHGHKTQQGHFIMTSSVAGTLYHHFMGMVNTAFFDKPGRQDWLRKMWRMLSCIP